MDRILKLGLPKRVKPDDPQQYRGEKEEMPAILALVVKEKPGGGKKRRIIVGFCNMHLP